MAKRTRTTLLNEINSYSKMISKVSTWRGTKKPFGHINNDTKENYVYEYWCYVSLLVEINKDTNQNVILIRGSNQFPTSPASKSGNWSYYEIRDSAGILLYIACAGTAIKRPDALKTAHHPDISFQNPSAPTSSDPSGNDVVMILDAKYQYPKKKNGLTKKVGKISKSNLDQFSHFVEVLLRSRKTQVTSLNFGKFKDLNGNCLLSNAKPLDKHRDACSIDAIKQVGEFVPGSVFKVVP